MYARLPLTHEKEIKNLKKNLSSRLRIKLSLLINCDVDTFYLTYGSVGSVIA